MSTRNHACWTCRLRRKRCDNAHPCRSCAELEIECHVSTSKPEWMDGGSRQKEMADSIKAQIKNGANGRRERRSIRNGRGAGSMAFVVTSQDDLSRSGNPAESVVHETPSLSQHSGDDNETSTTHRQHIPHHVSSSVTTTEETPSSLVQFASLGLAWEQDFVMIYLDYVFPFLFPYYRPPLVGTSRSWLLSFIEQNKIIRHSILSLSSFFFTIGIKDTLGESHHGPCNGTIWRDVVKHADRAFAMIQEDMLKKLGNEKLDLMQKVDIIETITQLLVFDSFVGSTAGWIMHLKPALSLLKECLQDHDTGDPSLPGLSGILQSPVWEASITECTIPPGRRRLWTPQQSALRFFTALLITIDIVASTALTSAPTLQQYHNTILADVAPDEIAAGLDLYSFFGCQNWALVSVGKIAAWDASKKEAQAHGGELEEGHHARGFYIFEEIDKGLESLDKESTPRSAHDVFRSQMFYNDPQFGQEGSDTCTRIWAHSARIYAYIVTWGFEPEMSKVTDDSARVKGLLRTVTSVAQLRTLAWPACVAGCVTTDKVERKSFAEFLRGIGHRLLLRNVHQAVDIMEAVWEKDGSITSQTWDLAACLGVLGTPALLF